MELTSMASAVGALLKQHDMTVAVSESSSGGLVSAALLSQPGASQYFQAGGVIYTGPARTEFLGLPPRLPKAVRSSSEPYAALAAEAIRARFDTTWGLAETGAAGPTGNSYGDAAGHTCIAVAGPRGFAHQSTLETASADREANMWAFAQAALDALLECVQAAAAKRD
ncbi:MAG: CinA family protein [Pseudomonadota bacterium]